MGNFYIAHEGRHFIWSNQEVDIVQRLATSYWPKVTPVHSELDAIVQAVNRYRDKRQYVDKLDVFLLLLDLAEKGCFDQINTSLGGLCDNSGPESSTGASTTKFET